MHTQCTQPMNAAVTVDKIITKFQIGLVAEFLLKRLFSIGNVKMFRNMTLNSA